MMRFRGEEILRGMKTMKITKIMKTFMTPTMARIRIRPKMIIL